MSSHLWRGIAATVLLSVCLSLFGFSVFFDQCSRYNRRTSVELYGKKLDQVGCVRIEESDTSQSVYELRKKIQALPGVKYTGDYVNVGTILDNLGEIQDGHQEDDVYTMSGDTEITFADAEMFEICGVKFQKDAKEYATMYAVGMSDRDILIITGIQNFLQLLIALALSVTAISLRMMLMIDTGKNKDWLKDVFRSVLYQGTIPVVLLLVVILFFVITMIPMLIFQRFSPVDIWKERRLQINLPRIIKTKATTKQSRHRKVWFRDRSTDLLLMVSFIVIFVALANCFGLFRSMQMNDDVVVDRKENSSVESYCLKNTVSDSEEVFEPTEGDIDKLFQELSNNSNRMAILKTEINIGNGMESYPIEIVLSGSQKSGMKGKSNEPKRMQ